MFFGERILATQKVYFTIYEATMPSKRRREREVKNGKQKIQEKR